MDLRQACFQEAAAAARTRALFASALARRLAAGNDRPDGPDPADETSAAALFRLRRFALELCDPTELPAEAGRLLLDAELRAEIALAAGLAYADAPFPAVMKGAEFQQWAADFSPFAVKFAAHAATRSAMPRAPASRGGARPVITREGAVEIGLVGLSSWLASRDAAWAGWTNALSHASASASFVDVRRAATLARLAWTMHEEERVLDHHS